MSKYCPFRKEQVIYLICQECDDKEACRNFEYKEQKVEDLSKKTRTIVADALSN